MKNILPKLQQYITIVGVITAIGGGFYTWGQFNLRLDNIEKRKFKTVNIAPLETKVDSLEKRLDRVEGRVDNIGNNDNPLAN
jgi:tetrahydromethanopterin S-methyltransferase subunit G|tara:strand:+ start:1833 stop:2078 length:246 start_codon:yes stop_codon:yes gene_type:complete